MFALRILAGAVVAFFVALSLAATAQGSGAVEPAGDYKVLSRFFKAVDSYVVQHHRVFRPLPEEIMCLPDDTLAEINALAELPRDMRPAPREGVIFQPDVAALFKRRLAATVRRHEHDRLGLLDEMDEGVLVAPPVLVDEPMPWTFGDGRLGTLTSDLPLLPEELAYRFVGRDLVLVDVGSNLVVDIVRAALPLY